ncbi:diadenylate cyclase CdaA [Clostridium grantii]|uniref:Diadenylate cyclase n=1 Tax=Clostridium grantii DSM 8605 TaxID=1121316 RepID=A0A1M5TSU6_9CLOT|nr:diadenylate cyclase CdaA [Clostridium grantii]SHH53748.1 diadenylate cyclase [Clostridium grantii DSM 8605]
MEFLNIILNTIKSINIFSILDIVSVSFIFYQVYMLLRKTRAEQLLKGILLVVLLIPISSLLQLQTLNWILNKTITIGVLSLVIIFQPEIRKALEHIGRSAFTEKHIFQDDETISVIISEITKAVENLSASKTGALIVIEQKTGLSDIIETGTKIDGNTSAALLENIFVENTPLHDGAVVIRSNRIAACGCFLPLSSDRNISKQLGTRHRAAVGISEVSDALTIIVSEETGVISLAVNGKLTRYYSNEKLKAILIKIIQYRRDKKITIGEKVKSWVKIKIKA